MRDISRGFLGHSVAQQKNVSESTAQKIDNEILRLIDEAYETARRILIEKNHEFVALRKDCSNTKR